MPVLQRWAFLRTESDHDVALFRQLVGQCDTGRQVERSWASMGEATAARCSLLQVSPAGRRRELLARPMPPSYVALWRSFFRRQLRGWAGDDGLMADRQIVFPAGGTRACSCTRRQRSSEVYRRRSVSSLEGDDRLLLTGFAGAFARDFLVGLLLRAASTVCCLSWLPFTSSLGIRHCIARGRSHR